MKNTTLLIVMLVLLLAGSVVGQDGKYRRHTVVDRYYPAILNDTSSPHQLTLAEVANSVITTQGWNGTDDIQFGLPDISGFDGSEPVYRVKFEDDIGMQDADTDFYVDPDAATQIVLDGIATGTDGHRVWIDNPNLYDAFFCHTNWSSALGGFWVCNTIVGVPLDKGS